MNNNTLHQSLGASVSSQKTIHGLSIQTENALVQVTVYASQTIRVQITRTPNLPDYFSYAVVAMPQNVPFSYHDYHDKWKLETEHIVLEISKSPVRFTFKNKQGQILSEDDAAFGTGWIGNEISTYKKLQPYERFLGLGEKTGPLDKRGRAYTNWNTDNFAYSSESDPLYQSLPFYLGVHSGVTYGLFMDNCHRSWFNFGASNNRFASFSAEDGDMNYYFVYDHDVAGILKAYTALTGRAEMPPLWSLGLQQCRYSYYPDTEVLSIARNYRDRQIPADVIYLDIHYMQDYKVFTWNKERFPTPEKMLQTLDEQGFKTVVIIDPGIKTEEGYAPYDEGVAQNLFLKYPDGQDYTAAVWPGWCHFPDFTNPETRTWWAEKFQELSEQGIAGFWNDMNEPASWGQRTPDLVEFHYEGQKSSHKKGHNVYGLQMARATYEGAKLQKPHLRPFVLTRAGYSGIQRYAAVWTGDNVASDDHLLAGVRLLTSMGLTGVSFTGMDIGGFVGESSKDLFGRWISVSAFTAFFRIHTMIDNKEVDPWSFGERIEAVAKNYVRLRYKLLPYLYTAFWENTQTGMPLVRSLAIEYPHDERVYWHIYHNQFMCGASLLVCPAESHQRFCKVYLPAHEGGWYDFYTDAYYAGGQEIIVECPIERLPVFVKGASVITTQTVVQNTTQRPEPVLHLHLYRGKGQATAFWYEDDGLTHAHTEGIYYKRQLNFFPVERKLVIQHVEGSFASAFSQIKVYLHDFGAVDGLRQGVHRWPTHAEAVEWLEQLPNFDPFGDMRGAKLQANCAVAVIDNIPETIVLEW